jgi:hypothetical protein
MKPSYPWKIILTFVGIILLSFTAGYLAGSGTTRQAIERRFDPEQWNTYAMKVLDQRLHLQDSQRQAIQQAINHAVRDMKAVREETVRETRQIVKNLLDEIGSELTPEQQALAESLAPTEEELTIDLLKVK